MPTRREPTIRDVAAHAGVSHQTVSRVLNGSKRVRPETQHTVLESINTLGYRPNSSARRLGRARRPRTAALPASAIQLHGAVPSRAVAMLVKQRAASGITSHNAALWPVPAAAITDHLGWTDSYRTMQGLLPQLRRLHAELTQHGLTHLVLISTNPNTELITALQSGRGRTLTVLDTAHPAGITAALQHEPARTAFLIDTRNVSTEADALLRIVQDELTRRDLYAFNGRIVFIANRGTAPQRLAVAVGYPVIEADPAIPPIFTGLDVHTLVPAYLAGGRINRVLTAAERATFLLCRDSPDNPALRLGAALGADTVTRVRLSATPSARPLLSWVQRLLQATLDLSAMRDDGTPPAVGELRIHLASSAPGPLPHDGIVVEGTIGAQLLTWQYAVTAASILLRRNPFERAEAAQPQLAFIRHRSTKTITSDSDTHLNGRTHQRRSRALVRFIRHAPKGALVVHIYGDPEQHEPIAQALSRAAHRFERDLVVQWSPRAEHSPGVRRFPGQAHAQIVVAGPDTPVPGVAWTLLDLIRARAREAAALLQEQDCPVLSIDGDPDDLIATLASVTT